MILAVEFYRCSLSLKKSFFFFGYGAVCEISARAWSHALMAGFSHWVTREVRQLPFIPYLLKFVKLRKDIGFVRFFYHVYWGLVVGFVFHFIAIICYTKWFSDVKPPCIPEQSCLFMCWWTWFAGYFEDFCVDYQEEVVQFFLVYFQWYLWFCIRVILAWWNELKCFLLHIFWMFLNNWY